MSLIKKSPLNSSRFYPFLFCLYTLFMGVSAILPWFSLGPANWGHGWMFLLFEPPYSLVILLGSVLFCMGCFQTEPFRLGRFRFGPHPCILAMLGLGLILAALIWTALTWYIFPVTGYFRLAFALRVLQPGFCLFLCMLHACWLGYRRQHMKQRNPAGRFS